MKLNIFNKRRFGFPKLGRVALLLAASLMAACASLPGEKPEDAVLRRAQARWDALIAGDIDTAYGYLPPSYRALHDIKQYRGAISAVVQRKGAQVVGVECKPEVCTATIKVDVNFAPMMSATKSFSTHFEEQWIVEDGAWWVFEKQ